MAAAGAGSASFDVTKYQLSTGHFPITSQALKGMRSDPSVDAQLQEYKTLWIVFDGQLEVLSIPVSHLPLCHSRYFRDIIGHDKTGGGLFFYKDPVDPITLRIALELCVRQPPMRTTGYETESRIQRLVQQLLRFEALDEDIVRAIWDNVVPKHMFSSILQFQKFVRESAVTPELVEEETHMLRRIVSGDEVDDEEHRFAEASKNFFGAARHSPFMRRRPRAWFGGTVDETATHHFHISEGKKRIYFSEEFAAFLERHGNTIAQLLREIARLPKSVKFSIIVSHRVGYGRQLRWTIMRK